MASAANQSSKAAGRKKSMKADEQTQVLSAIFVDYDNIYMSLKRKSEDAAKRFAKLSQDWLKGIETGALITATNGVLGNARRRIVMNRCYGNPVPRRNSHDNATDMSSFPFVRHYFLRAGCEVVDCPPLTAQLKNSSDIRMVMDVRDYLTHETYFDEFVILSGDADFTPVLQRLRQHARRTVIYCNEYTAQPYTAICDGEVREADLIALLLAQDAGAPELITSKTAPPPAASVPELRQEIIAEVLSLIRSAPSPQPLEALADRAIRTLGHEKTVNTSWAGAGSFRELLRQSLPADIQLTEVPPYLAYDPKRHSLAPPRAPTLNTQPQPASPSAPQSPAQAPSMRPSSPVAPKIAPPMSAQMPATDVYADVTAPPRPAISSPREPSPSRMPAAAPPIAARSTSREQAPLPVQRTAPAPTPVATSMQQSIARIYEACQAPPLAPAEYRATFEVLSDEINDKGLAGAQTLNNIVERARARGFELRRDDARFILEVVSEADPWFDQGASATLFGGRFRNFVVARCRSHGLDLSAEELDLIDNWFAGLATATPSRTPVPSPQPTDNRAASRWWPGSGQSAAAAERAADEAIENAAGQGDDLPRFVRTRRA
jgi:NYN domain-containing protein